MTPRIPGVGIIRQRYPIMPVHQAGSFEYKELDALKDVTLEAGVYKRFYRHKREMNGTLEEVIFKTPPVFSQSIHKNSITRLNLLFKLLLPNRSTLQWLTCSSEVRTCC